jgi:hypothetical protein
MIGEFEEINFNRNGNKITLKKRSRLQQKTQSRFFATG